MASRQLRLQPAEAEFHSIWIQVVNLANLAGGTGSIASGYFGITTGDAHAAAELHTHWILSNLANRVGGTDSKPAKGCIKIITLKIIALAKQPRPRRLASGEWILAEAPAKP